MADIPRHLVVISYDVLGAGKDIRNLGTCFVVVVVVLWNSSDLFYIPGYLRILLAGLLLCPVLCYTYCLLLPVQLLFTMDVGPRI